MCVNPYYPKPYNSIGCYEVTEVILPDYLIKKLCHV